MFLDKSSLARILLTVVASGPCAGAVAQGESVTPRSPLALGAWEGGAARRALAGARRKLEQAECQRLLVDFKDAAGRTLQENLTDWNVGPSEYAALVPFLDGSRQPLCRKTTVGLVSSPGVRRVFVCPSFADFQVRHQSLAQSLVIHDILHTLGLGENPPTPDVITQRVEARCR